MARYWADDRGVSEKERGVMELGVWDFARFAVKEARSVTKPPLRAAERGETVKYFYFVDDKNGTHVIAASSLKSATRVVAEAGMAITDLYELCPDTFRDEGFLISRK